MEAPACLRTLPGAIRGRVLHHHSLPYTAFQHPFPSNSFKNNNNKTQLAEPGIVSWELIAEGSLVANSSGSP